MLDETSIVFSSIVGTTMGRTFSAVPYTYLKRGVYYLVRRLPSDLQTFYLTDRVILSLRTKHTVSDVVWNKSCEHRFKVLITQGNYSLQSTLGTPYC